MADKSKDEDSKQRGKRLNRILKSDLLVDVGDWTSFILIALIFSIQIGWIADLLYPHYQKIGIIFLVSQLLEILARDHLSMRQVYKDHAKSLLAFFVAFGLWALHLSSGILTDKAWEILWWWGLYAFVDSVFGIAIANVILNAPYQREERAAD